MEKRKILIIEDEVNIRRPWEQVLSSEGHEVHTLASGVHAKRELRRLKPDLIILDLSMPTTGREEGFRVLEDMSKISQRPSVIIATGVYRRDEVEEILDNIECRKFVDRIMIKPFSNDDLIDAVKEVLK